ncbi:MAG: hypothetical protein HC837_07060 [Chloroflexaceae bacterium]|nr:hypothetical protein [Chloroflexaceae bacterium]
MNIFVRLPNIQSMREAHLVEPDQNDVSRSSRSIGELMRLGAGVMRAAQRQAPAAQSIVVVTNEHDIVVNRQMIHQLVERWQGHGKAVQTLTIAASHHLGHDCIDPAQPDQNTALVYPMLADVMMQSALTRGPSPKGGEGS